MLNPYKTSKYFLIINIHYMPEWFQFVMMLVKKVSHWMPAHDIFSNAECNITSCVIRKQLLLRITKRLRDSCHFMIYLLHYFSMAFENRRKLNHKYPISIIVKTYLRTLWMSSYVSGNWICFCNLSRHYPIIENMNGWQNNGH